MSGFTEAHGIPASVQPNQKLNTTSLVQFASVSTPDVSTLDNNLTVRVGPPYAIWANIIGDAGQNEYGSAVAHDSVGNVIIVGAIDTYPTLGHLIVTKLSPVGDVIWQKSVLNPTTVYQTGDAIAVDSNDNIYVVGTEDGAINYIVITKLSSDGTLVWQNTLTSASYFYVASATIDAQDNFILAYVGNVALIAKYDSTGTLVWNYEIQSVGGSSLIDVATDTSSNVYVTCTVGDGVISQELLIQLNAAGVEQWATVLQPTVEPFYTTVLGTSGKATALDTSGNVYVLVHSTLQHTVNLDSIQTYTLVKVNPQGVIQWSKALYSAAVIIRVEGITTDVQGNVYLSSYNDSGTLYQYLTIMKLDGAGNQLWQHSVRSTTGGLVSQYYYYGFKSLVAYGDSLLVTGHTTSTIVGSYTNDAFVLSIPLSGLGAGGTYGALMYDVDTTITMLPQSTMVASSPVTHSLVGSVSTTTTPTIGVVATSNVATAKTIRDRSTGTPFVFDLNGAVTFADASVQTTAWTGVAPTALSADKLTNGTSEATLSPTGTLTSTSVSTTDAYVTTIHFGDLTTMSTTPVPTVPTHPPYTKLVDIINPSVYSTQGGDNFTNGNSVVVHGGMLIVGAYGEDTAQLAGAGVIYIFDVVTGELLRTIQNPSTITTSGDSSIGYVFAASGPYLVVTSSSEQVSSVGSAGRAWIFNLHTGQLIRTIDNPNTYGTLLFDQFGTAATIAGEYVAISASQEDTAAGLDSGVVYVFNVTTGQLLYTLVNPNPVGTVTNDNFGSAIDSSGNYLVVGAYRENSQSGYLYIYNIKTGALLFSIPNPNAAGTGTNDKFAERVSTDGKYVAASAVWEDIPFSQSGSVYVFDVTTGALVRRFDSPTNFQEVFGSLVRVCDGKLLVSMQDVGANRAGRSLLYDIVTGALIQEFTNPNATGTPDNDYFGHAGGMSSEFIALGTWFEQPTDGSAGYSGVMYTFTNNRVLLAGSSTLSSVSALTFADRSMQTTAWTGGRLTALPPTSVGLVGDLAGDFAFSSYGIYYCTSDYDGTTNVWKRISWSVDTW